MTGHNGRMNVHECDGCGAIAETETVLPPAGWVRRGGRKVQGGVGRWLLVLCPDCEAGEHQVAGADGRN
jgi:hypothetical protein